MPKSPAALRAEISFIDSCRRRHDSSTAAAACASSLATRAALGDILCDLVRQAHEQVVCGNGQTGWQIASPARAALGVCATQHVDQRLALVAISLSMLSMTASIVSTSECRSRANGRCGRRQRIVRVSERKKEKEKKEKEGEERKKERREQGRREKKKGGRGEKRIVNEKGREWIGQ